VFSDQCPEKSKKKLLTPRQQKALMTVLTMGGSVEKCAAKLGLNRRTLSRWLRQPEFQEALEALRIATLKRAKDRLRAATEGAVAVLIQVMAGSSSENARIRAALAVIEYGLFDGDLSDLASKADRLQEIFRRYKEESRL